ncbi:GGDEF domain-containing protein [Pseudorhodoferax sp.]|uniref:GGDEF domain-containing protein n=1 Tax=Pseudorhodoferax sp. TaxID=1993553 RepID=UPI002DD6A771|nr:tetratricopeptide repeat-containing diguanylate cyclase [Pseudorhodoferax sp.]
MAAAPALAMALARAEAARVANQSAQGLAAAEEAWSASADGGAADPATRLAAGRLLLHFCYRTGALARVVEASTEVLALMREAGVPVAEQVDTLRMVTISAADTGRFDLAVRLGYEALGLADGVGDLARVSLIVNALGCVYERIGDPWHAERLLTDALAIARQAQAAPAEFTALNNLTGVLIGAYYLLDGVAPADEARGTLERALACIEQAMALGPVMAEDFYQVFVRGNLGEVLVHLGRLDDARRELGAALAIAERNGHDAQLWRIRTSIAELHLREGAAETAWQHLQDVLRLSAVTDVPVVHLRVHHALWRTAQALGRPQEALAHLERYQQHERQRLLSQLRGRSQLFVTKVEAEQVRLEARRAGERATQAEVDARIDQLTGLGNRRELDLRWLPLAERLQREQRPLALAMVDLDHFKQINDRYGHAIGDEVLVVMARLLRENTRAHDVVVRVGGEEFLAVLPEVDARGALEICERLRQRVAAYPWAGLGGGQAAGLSVSLSVGLASAPPYELRPLLDRADAALYAVKRSGRNQVRVG